MGRKNVVIVGGGQAAAMCAVALREKKFEGQIAIIGDETYAPYERPELSKKLVSGDCSLESITILDTARAEKLGIQLLTGCTVQALDCATQTVRTEEGDFAYDWLVLATGGRARRLDQAAITGLPALSIRTVTDAVSLRGYLGPGKHVAVIGGGWLGLEIAASCRQAGMEVDVLEASARLCSRVAPPALSQALKALHIDNDVRVHCGRALAFRPGGLSLDDEIEIRPDFLVLAVGMDANDRIATEAGLETECGILVDAAFQTADPKVFAIGDCAARRTPEGHSVRIESWQNANYSAVVAACGIVGDTPPPDEPLWFWSDQFGRRLQMAGDLSAPDEIIERATAPDERLVFHLRGGVLLGIWAVGSVREFAQARRWLKRPTHLNVDRLSDTGLPLSAAVS